MMKWVVITNNNNNIDVIVVCRTSNTVDNATLHFRSTSWQDHDAKFITITEVVETVKAKMNPHHQTPHTMIKPPNEGKNDDVAERRIKIRNDDKEIELE